MKPPISCTAATVTLMTPVLSHVITPAATLSSTCPSTTSHFTAAAGSDELFGIEGAGLWKRDDTFCDQVGLMRCSTGTCFTDQSGLVDCCTVSSCVPRTECIDYHTGVTALCHPDTGGCTYCSDPRAPYCQTILNTYQDQSSHTCGTEATTRITLYTNSITASSRAWNRFEHSSELAAQIQPIPQSSPTPTSNTPASALSSTAETDTDTAPTTSLPYPAMADPDSLPSDGTTFSQHGEAISAHSATHAALISGVACGTAVILCLLCALCWAGRRRIMGWYCRLRTRMGMKALSDKETPSSTASEWSVHRNASTRGKDGKEDLGRSDSTNWTRHDLRKTSVATPGTAPHDVSNLGIGLRGLQEGDRVKYTCLNPDPISATTAGEQTRAGSVPPWMQYPAGNSSAPTLPLITAVPQNPFLDHSLPASPSVSSMPLPITPATDSDTATPTTASTATRSPTSPVWSTPYQTQTQLASSRPQYAGHRLQTPDHEEKEVYTPSLYQQYPPTSLTRAHPTYNPQYPNTSTSTSANTNHPPSLRPSYSPAHLPHPYSTVSLGSTAEIYRRLESCTDLYRGLSSRVSPGKGGAGERPPWDYLSAEDARGGGWRNSDGGVSTAETGWETVGDEGKGSEEVKRGD